MGSSRRIDAMARFVNFGFFLLATGSGLVAIPCAAD